MMDQKHPRDDEHGGEEEGLPNPKRQRLEHNNAPEAGPDPNFAAPNPQNEVKNQVAGQVAGPAAVVQELRDDETPIPIAAFAQFPGSQPAGESREKKVLAQEPPKSESMSDHIQESAASPVSSGADNITNFAVPEAGADPNLAAPISPNEVENQGADQVAGLATVQGFPDDDKSISMQLAAESKIVESQPGYESQGNGVSAQGYPESESIPGPIEDSAVETQPPILQQMNPETTRTDVSSPAAGKIHEIGVDAQESSGTESVPGHAEDSAALPVSSESQPPDTHMPDAEPQAIDLSTATNHNDDVVISSVESQKSPTLTNDDGKNGLQPYGAYVGPNSPHIKKSAEDFIGANDDRSFARQDAAGNAEENDEMESGSSQDFETPPSSPPPTTLADTVSKSDSIPVPVLMQVPTTAAGLRIGDPEIGASVPADEDVDMDGTHSNVPITTDISSPTSGVLDASNTPPSSPPPTTLGNTIFKADSILTPVANQTPSSADIRGTSVTGTSFSVPAGGDFDMNGIQANSDVTSEPARPAVSSTADGSMDAPAAPPLKKNEDHPENQGQSATSSSVSTEVKQKSSSLQSCRGSDAEILHQMPKHGHISIESLKSILFGPQTNLKEVKEFYARVLRLEAEGSLVRWDDALRLPIADDLEKRAGTVIPGQHSAPPVQAPAAGDQSTPKGSSKEKAAQMLEPPNSFHGLGGDSESAGKKKESVSQSEGCSTPLILGNISAAMLLQKVPNIKKDAASVLPEDHQTAVLAAHEKNEDRSLSIAKGQDSKLISESPAKLTTESISQKQDDDLPMSSQSSARKLRSSNSVTATQNNMAVVVTETPKEDLELTVNGSKKYSSAAVPAEKEPNEKGAGSTTSKPKFMASDSKSGRSKHGVQNSTTDRPKANSDGNGSTSKVTVDLTGNPGNSALNPVEVDEPEPVAFTPIMKPLPEREPGSSNVFPRYKGQAASVFIILSHDNPKYQYKLGYKKIVEASEALEKLMGIEVKEVDAELAAQHLDHVKKACRLELVLSTKTQRWVLKRVPFTVNVPVGDNYQKAPEAPQALLRAYNNLFLTIYGKPISAENNEEGLRDCVRLASLAPRYCRKGVGFVRASIHAVLSEPARVVFRAVKSDPVGMLNFAVTTQNGPLFKEAMIHIVGNYPESHIVGNYPEWKWETKKEEISPEVMKLIDAKYKTLRTKKRQVNSALAENGISIENEPVWPDSDNKDMFEASVIQSMWKGWFERHKSGPPSKLGSFYRLLAAGGDAYLSSDSTGNLLKNYRGPDFGVWDAVPEDLAIMKDYAVESVLVQELVVNNSALSVVKENITWLTCTEIGDEELPWVSKSTGKE